MIVVEFTEKRPPDIRAVKWRGKPAEAHEFAKLWRDAYSFTFHVKDEALTVNRPDGKSLILVRGTLVEVEESPDWEEPFNPGATRLVAKRILSTIDLDGYAIKSVSA